MQILNLQDGIIKSPLVQQMQEQAAAVFRAEEGARRTFHDEMARQAEETTQETAQSENETIREDEEHPSGRRPPRRRQPSLPEGEDAPEAPAAENQTGSHRIDIVA